MTEAGKTPWLHAWYDPIANLKICHSSCVRMADISCDGDYKLIICDYQDKRMKVYKGTSVII